MTKKQPFELKAEHVVAGVVALAIVAFAKGFVEQFFTNLGKREENRFLH